MRKIFVLSLVFSSMGLIQAQEADAGVWQNIQTAGVRLLLPADWQPLSAGMFMHEDVQLTIDDTCPAEDSLAGWADSAAEAIAADDEALLNRETVMLPLGEAIRITWRDSDERWHVAYFALAAEDCLSVQADAPEEMLILAQIVNTISWVDADVPGKWNLNADPNLVLTIRTPQSWQKLPVQNSLMVRETFDDVLVQIQYRDMGGTTQVAALQPQFDALYTERGYTLAQVQLVQLPAGDTLLYHLENVTVGSRIQTQFHAILMRGNYLILATLGADQTYFQEYEPTLLQMLDTLTFDEARLP